ncbi:MAG: hypothetical protein HXX12_08335 [Geothrix sp.]|uniref:hypothetical protein n=1 Tax=Geothrix sp. TaxID=1962974 RepID=UPI0017D7A130|nr:hypothetical protein [Geothrix sp.]NWJ40966.1 hypothetical protein [Geothrix sp.]WIL21037.1 MAG: hypothetical protein QOZ81_000281 [Geothrix sp.]
MSHDPKPTHEVIILVNENPVKMVAHKANGAEIKAAAIAQGVQIQQDFLLSEELGAQRSRVVGDVDEVPLHKDQRFIAVAPDDNS